MEPSPCRGRTGNAFPTRRGSLSPAQEFSAPDAFVSPASSRRMVSPPLYRAQNLPPLHLLSVPLYPVCLNGDTLALQLTGDVFPLAASLL
jgi:hypothetical protein